MKLLKNLNTSQIVTVIKLRKVDKEKDNWRTSRDSYKIVTVKE